MENFEPKPQVPRQEARPWDEKIAAYAESFWDLYPEPAERIDRIKKKVKVIAEQVLEDSEAFMASIEACQYIEEKEVFVQAIVSAVEPLRQARLEDPVGFEAAQREYFYAIEKFIQVNDLISYSLKGSTVEIHIAPSQTVSMGKKLTMLREGLTGLAKVVQENEDVETITGTSWIVAQHPALMEKLGFEVEGQISDDEMREEFPAENREVHRARINRQELLDKYL